jgi:hypothetical protein
MINAKVNNIPVAVPGRHCEEARTMGRLLSVRHARRWGLLAGLLILFTGGTKPAVSDPLWLLRGSDEFVDAADISIIDSIQREPMIPPGDHGTGRPPGPDFDPFVDVNVGIVELGPKRPGVDPLIVRFVITFTAFPGTRVWYRFHPSEGPEASGRIDFPRGTPDGGPTSITGIYDLPVYRTMMGWFGVITGARPWNSRLVHTAEWASIPFSAIYPTPVGWSGGSPRTGQGSQGNP